MAELVSAPALIFYLSALCCALIVATKNLHLGRSARGHAGSAVQSAHEAPTPRIGGVALVLAFVVSVFFAPASMLDNYIPFVVSLIPVFVAGLAEDFGFNVSPRARLAAAALSGAAAVFLLGMWITNVGVAPLDWLFSFAPVAICLTVFATAGACHSFNLIDGLNGLAGGTAILITVGLAVIAAKTNHAGFVPVSFLLVAALAGFLLLNFPFGRLFLGDAGAYSIGHVLAWFGILLIERNSDVSPWAVLLVFFWPVADTLFAIVRRKVAGGKFDRPDRLHFHQLVMRSLELFWFGRGRRAWANPLATLIIIPFVAAPVLVGTLVWDDRNMAILLLAVFGLAFVSSYYILLRLAVRLRPCLGRRRLLQRRAIGAKSGSTFKSAT